MMEIMNGADRRPTSPAGWLTTPVGVRAYARTTSTVVARGAWLGAAKNIR